MKVAETGGVSRFVAFPQRPGGSFVSKYRADTGPVALSATRLEGLLAALEFITRTPRSAHYPPGAKVARKQGKDV